MMPRRKMLRMIGSNTARNAGEFALSTFGIVFGIAAFVFFMGLSGGARNWLLGEDLFPLERLEVIAPKANVGIAKQTVLDDAVVERIRTRPEVAYAIPRLLLSFPARGDGNFEGQRIPFEFGGFCDGISAQLVADESFSDLFRDWETDDYLATAPACKSRPRWVCAERGARCGGDQRCHPKGGAPPGQELAPCIRADDYFCDDRDHTYCDRRDLKCHHRVPVIISPALIEIFNKSFAISHGLPQIPAGGVSVFIALRGYAAMRFSLVLGESFVSGATKRVQAASRTMEAYVIGESSKAIPIGGTVPIEYVKRWNAEFESEAAAKSYSSIVVQVKDKEEIPAFSSWLHSQERLELEDSQGESFATAIFGMTLVLLVISGIIILISALNIAHTFFMQVAERRREIGLLRALGATKADVRLIILGESGLIGLIGGLLGVGLALAVGWAGDHYLASSVPDFPFKPPTMFDFTPGLIGSAIGFAVLFCMLGGFLPARKAARMEPAQALAAQ